LPPEAAGTDTTLALRLPMVAQCRREVQTMINFGPRITASAAHNRYIACLERAFGGPAASCRCCADKELTVAHA
jgi:hypothetical protein